MVMPYLRLSQPKPPPSVSPAMPVVELMPTGVARPWAWVAASRSASVAPPSMVTRRAPGSTRRGLHLREVDYDTVVAHGIAGDVVPAAADGEQEPVVPREVHRGDDVRRGGAADDERGVLVDHRVPDLACAFVGIVARKKNFAAEVIFQLLHFCCLYIRHVFLLSKIWKIALSTYGRYSDR